MSSLKIFLMATYDITHGLAKISNLKFLKSPAALSPLEIYLRATYDMSHGLAKISNLKFLKSPAIAVFIGDFFEVHI